MGHASDHALKEPTFVASQNHIAIIQFQKKNAGMIFWKYHTPANTDLRNKHNTSNESYDDT